MHDATLNDLCVRATYDLGVFPADIRHMIDQDVPSEREKLKKRRQELLSQIVPKAQDIADELLTRAQRATADVRELNQGLNAQEERLKANLAQMQAELKRLNDEIVRRSGCLAVFINFFKLMELDRKRQRLLGRMEENARELKKVREEWAKARANYATEETKLQESWQQATIQAAQAREELDQLSDDAKLERLALQRAVFYVFDNWKTSIPSPSGGSPLIDEINQMVQFNIQQDAYEEGLGKVAGLIALLNGLSSGLQSFGQSVEAVIKEQQRHSAYLTPVRMDVEDQVIQFHKQWDDLRAKVKDEEALGRHPSEFSALFDSEVKAPLSEANIKRMFDSLGSSLSAATRGWKG
jgi:chromosome segregation ATPase